MTPDGATMLVAALLIAAMAFVAGQLVPGGGVALVALVGAAWPIVAVTRLGAGRCPMK